MELMQYRKGASLKKPLRHQFTKDDSKKPIKLVVVEGKGSSRSQCMWKMLVKTVDSTGNPGGS